MKIMPFREDRMKAYLTEAQLSKYERAYGILGSAGPCDAGRLSECLNLSEELIGELPVTLGEIPAQILRGILQNHGELQSAYVGNLPKGPEKEEALSRMENFRTLNRL